VDLGDVPKVRSVPALRPLMMRFAQAPSPIAQVFSDLARASGHERECQNSIKRGRNCRRQQSDVTNILIVGIDQHLKPQPLK
jgi:hypothetical protein